MNLVITLSNFFIQYPIIIALIGPFISEDVSTLFLATLAGQRILNVWLVFFICLFGIVFDDVIWVYMSRAGLNQIFMRKKSLKRGYDVLNKRLKEATGERRFVTLLVSKFIYGTRFFTIAYYGKEMNLGRFIVYDTINTAIWLCVVVPLGWLAGKGLGNALNTFQYLQTWVFYILVIFIVALILRWGLKRVLGDLGREKKRRKKKKRVS